MKHVGVSQKSAEGNMLEFTLSSEGTLRIQLSGDWTCGKPIAKADDIRQQIESMPQIRNITYDARDLRGWDSCLLTFLINVDHLCADKNIRVDQDGLPRGARRLLALASAVPERKGARKLVERIPFLERLGGSAVDFWKSSADMLDFIGASFIASARMLRGKAQFRRSDLFLVMQECGAEALPIVSLISLLVGLILAYVGAMQLRLFGAQIFVADLVGIAMVREMSAIMTGIIIAGRTGASFAAQLGTMQVNEEIDALQTLGISPMEFLVLPRMLALVFMMPLLCLYADLMGVIGGLVVGVVMLDLNFMEYYLRTREAVSLNDFWIGLFMSAVFGILIALAGCLRGIQCGRSAAAVGEATTSAVVTGIVSIIVATAIITVICDVLKI
jgi:phospholipid/cholesterol/gamma-HCH transport system permease protein